MNDDVTPLIATSSVNALPLIRPVHGPDPLGNLLKISEFLAQDGPLFVEVPNYYAPNGFYLWKCKGIDYPSSNHLFVYSRRTLSAFLARAGFSARPGIPCRTSG